MDKITPIGWIAIIAIVTITVSFLGAVYLEPSGDYITTSTKGTIVQYQGEYLGGVLRDLGHSLAMFWIFVGVMFFIAVCIIAYFKTRPKKVINNYYGYYR